MSDILPIVPFGKYKGKPVTEMMSDKGYIDWLKQQPWFVNQKNQIYNIVVNQQINPSQSKTPEHNRLQNLFLSKNNLLQFYKYTYTNIIKEKYSKCVFGCMERGFSSPPKAEFEGCFNWDVVLDGGYMEWNKHKQNCDHEEDMACNKSCYYENDDDSYDICSIYIEIKPSIGDDYPNVLRKMKTQIELTRKKMADRKEKDINSEEDYKLKSWLRTSSKRYAGRYFLLVKDFQSSTTTADELRDIFFQTGINVIFFGDIFTDIPRLRSDVASDVSEKFEDDTVIKRLLPRPIDNAGNETIVIADDAKEDKVVDIQSYQLLEKRVVYLENLVMKMMWKIGLENE